MQPLVANFALSPGVHSHTSPGDLDSHGGQFSAKKKQLRFISAAAALRPEEVRDHAELLAEVQKMSAMPPPQILRVESMQSEPSAPWPGGFQSSLASFK